MNSFSDRSAAELVKERSRQLRGNIAEELTLEGPSFSKETVQILKFHGVYQQTDRDGRREQKPTEYSAMVRLSIPAGLLSAGQYLAMDRLAEEVGEGSLRITTRQDIQYHRVRKTDLHNLIRTLNENLLTTLAACGDVVRNVVCCPAPLADGHRCELHRYAQVLSKRLKPKTQAYYEIWMDGEKAVAAEPAAADHEPLYGVTYLPRKFKIGIAPPGDNCTDIYTNDVGIVPAYTGPALRGFTLLAGGGLGMSPGVKATHPRLADPVCFIPPELLGDAVEAMIAIHRDYGNRANRKLARLKYVIEDWGVPRFKAEVERRLGRPLENPAPLSWITEQDHLGWHAQADGLWFLGLRVLSGRIKDENGTRLRTGLREVIAQFQPGVHLTPQQNILLSGIRSEDRGEVEAALRSHGILPPGALPPVFRQALACPALPTCGLAITEAERVLPDLLNEIQSELGAADLRDEPVAIRVTGCPNGCARPYTAEIGLVGQSVGMYVIYLGGSHLGTRLGFVYRENVKRHEIRASLRPVFEAFRKNRWSGERFGDFCHRTGRDALLAGAAEISRREALTT